MADNHHLGLLNTSWTCHRLSPLHHGPIKSENGSGPTSLLTNQAALNTFAARLKDHLTNSFADAQGWHAGAGAGPGDNEPSTTGSLSSLGPLQSCTWEPISTLDFLSTNGSDEDAQEAEPVGLLITLSYETITYRAALLSISSGAPSHAQAQQVQPTKRKRGRPSLKSSSSSSTSSTLPLLLTRLPKQLRDSFLSFLSSNFDTYVSPLRISSAGLAGFLEGYINTIFTFPSSSTDAEGGAEAAASLLKELHLTLTFSAPIAPSLKSLNVSIPRETLASFLRDSLSTSASTSTSISEGKNRQRSGVLEGLSGYVRRHLAMELGLPSTLLETSSGGLPLVGGYVRLTRIACAGFVVTSEGRLKIVARARASSEGQKEDEAALRGGEGLLRGVLERAAGVGNLWGGADADAGEEG